jgi:chromate reductase
MKLPIPTIKVLGLCGSLRQKSTNLSALQYMASQASNLGIDFIIADLTDVPFLNPDTEHDKSPAVVKLLKQFEEADAIVMASPEYNYSMAPALKNALDWGSRLPGNVGFQGKAAAILSAGGGLRGGRSHYHVRQVCVFLDLMVVNKPEVMLSSFDGTFDKETHELVSEKGQAMIVQQLTALKELSLKLNAKEAVVEEL